MGASNCPETPRQKMIQMMYLVYTAMLALNVAAEVLNGFVTVGDAMNKSNENIELKLEDSYANFQAAHKNNPEKTQEYYDKALKVQELSKGVRDYIDSLQYEFLCFLQSDAKVVKHIDGKVISRTIPLRNGETFLIDSARVAIAEGGLSVINKKDDNHSGGNFFYGMSDKATGKCVDLKNRIIQYKSDLKKLMGQDSASLQIALNVEQEMWSEHAKAMVPWEQMNFDNTIVIADMVVLSRLKAETMNAEFDAVNRLYALIKEGDFSFDKIAVIGRPKSTYIIQGGTYETDINIAAYDSKATFEAEINGQKLTSNDSGSVHYKTSCTATGQKQINAKIYVKQNNGTEVYEFKDSYYVAAPVATVELTKMNVVYAGIDNPVSISVAGMDSRNLVASIPGGGATISKDPSGKDGDYIIKAQKIGKIKVQVDGKEGKGASRTMGTKEIRVKKIPAPVLKIGNYKSGDMITKAELSSLGQIRAVMEDFDFQLPPLKISSFSFNVQGSGKLDVEGRGNRLDPTMISMINNAKKGQKVYISNVTVKTPDGITHNLEASFRLK